MGTVSLLEAAKRIKLKRFVLVSTDEVYGDVPIGHSQENDCLLPSSPYSASKAAQEHLVRAFSRTYGFDTVITRGCNTAGPWQHPEKFIPTIIRKLLRKENVPLYGDGTQKRMWMDVQDHASGILDVMERGIAGTAYNLGSTITLRNIDLVENICSIMGVTGTVEFVADRPGHDARYSVDYTQVKRRIGWIPKVDWQWCLKRTISWYQDHVEWANEKTWAAPWAQPKSH